MTAAVRDADFVGTEPRFRLVPFDRIKLRTDRAYLVKDLIPREGLIVIWGPPKCGKSFWTFDVAMHVALDRPYRGRKVTAGTVVYVACEGERGLGARAEAFRQRHLAESAEGIPFYLVTTRLDLIGEHAELIGEIRAQLPPGQKPVLLVVDTLNRSIRGSESRDEDMSAYVAAADAVREAFACAVALIHHCGIEGSRPRGHTSLTGAADAQIAVKRNRAIVCTVEHMKDGPTGAEIFSTLEVVDVGADTDGDPITSCIVLEAGAEEIPASGPKITPNQSTMLGILQDAGPGGLTVEEWNEQARVAGIGVKRKADHSDIRRALKGKRLIHTSGDRWYVSTKA